MVNTHLATLNFDFFVCFLNGTIRRFPGVLDYSLFTVDVWFLVCSKASTNKVHFCVLTFSGTPDSPLTVLVPLK